MPLGPCPHSSRSGPPAPVPSQLWGAAQPPHTLTAPLFPHGEPTPAPQESRGSLLVLEMPPAPHNPRCPSRCSGRLQPLRIPGGVSRASGRLQPLTTPLRPLRILRTPAPLAPSRNTRSRRAPPPAPPRSTAPVPRPRGYKGGSAGAHPRVASPSPVSLCRHLRCPVRQRAWKRWCGAARSWPVCPRRSCRRPGRRCCCTPSTARA